MPGASEPGFDDRTLEDLKERTVRGGVARVLSQGVVFVVRIGSLMVLARLLVPAEYGLVGMVGAVTGIFHLFKDAGLSMATVQRPTISDAQVSTLFWVNLLFGLVLALLTAALAPVLVAFYSEPRLFWVTIASGLAFLFNALGVQHAALLQRQMRFTTLAVIDAGAIASGGALGIAAALLGAGYWALVVMALTYPMAASLGAWLAVRWIPGWPRRDPEVGSMLRFGGTVSLNVIVTYLAYNLDKVLLGRFWGADVLGLYGRAYQLVNVPIENFNSAVGGVAFAALSRVHHAREELRNYFLKGYALTLALTVPVTIACGVLAPEIVMVVLGPKWQAATPLLRLLAPTILVFSILNPLGWLLFSCGMAGRSMRMALIIAPTVIAGYLLGMAHGPFGVALGFSAAMTLLVVPLCIIATRDTPISAGDLWRGVRPPLLAGLAAMAVALLVQWWIGTRLPPLPRLLVGGGLMVAVYAWVLLHVLGQYSLYREVLARLRHKPSPGRAAWGGG